MFDALVVSLRPEAHWNESTEKGICCQTCRGRITKGTEGAIVQEVPWNATWSKLQGPQTMVIRKNSSLVLGQQGDRLQCN